MIHSFDSDVATRYGLNEAILLNYINFWVEHNKANEVHHINGYYWMYNSVKAFNTQFPYMSEHVIRTALKKLVNEGLILTGNYNVNGYDRTTWYTITQMGVNVINHVSNTDITSETDVRTPNNPFTDDDRPHYDTVEAYAANNLTKMSTGNIQEFADFKDKLPDELIRWAVDEACSQGREKANWSYVKAILNNMIAKEMRTVEEANAAKEKRQKERESGQYSKRDSRQEMSEVEMILLNQRYVR